MNNPPIARLSSLLRRLGSAWRILQARATGAKIGPGCILGSGSDLQLGIAPPRAGRVELGKNCELAQGVVLHPYGGSVILGENVFLGPGAVIYGHGNVEIGHNTLISMHCRILSSSHTVPPAGVLIRSQPDILRPTKIGNDVWLGAGVTVLGGVTIGDGCVVGAGAVVTHDLPSGATAVGVPARVVRQRPPDGGTPLAQTK